MERIKERLLKANFLSGEEMELSKRGLFQARFFIWWDVDGNYKNWEKRFNALTQATGDTYTGEWEISSFDGPDVYNSALQ